jgi:O-antigen/teichoic acid export membrane protein
VAEPDWVGTGPQDISGLLGSRQPSKLDALRGELRNPLFRNAYALMLNGGLTGVLGLGFWVLAQHLYGRTDFGRNAAEIQAVMFIGGLTILNYMLLRFIPQAGTSTRRLVNVTYLIGAGAAVLIGLGFLLTLDSWGTSYKDLHGLGPGLLFLLFVLGWNVFTQQDGVFAGLRQAVWVPVQNVTYGVIKIALLLAFASLFPDTGILLATMIAVIVLLIPAELIIQRRLIPRHVRETAGMHRVPTAREVGRYLAGDYVGTMFSHASINFIPMLVARQLDNNDLYAVFAVVWILGLMLDLLALTMAMSLTVEGAFDTAKLAETCRSALRRTVVLLVPISLIVIATAWIDLRIFGEETADEGYLLLQLLAVATLPKALIELYVGVLRVRSKTHLVALLQAVRFLGVLVLVLVFVDSRHLIAVGWSVLAVQVVVALAVLPALLKASQVTPRKV